LFNRESTAGYGDGGRVQKGRGGEEVRNRSTYVSGANDQWTWERKGNEAVQKRQNFEHKLEHKEKKERIQLVSPRLWARMPASK